MDQVTSTNRLRMPSGAAKRSGNVTVVTDKPGIRKVDGQNWRFMALLLPCFGTGHSARIGDVGR